MTEVTYLVVPVSNSLLEALLRQRSVHSKQRRIRYQLTNSVGMCSGTGDVVVVPQGHHDEVFCDASGNPLRLRIQPSFDDDQEATDATEQGRLVFYLRSS